MRLVNVEDAKCHRNLREIWQCYCMCRILSVLVLMSTHNLLKQVNLWSCSKHDYRALVGRTGQKCCGRPDRPDQSSWEAPDSAPDSRQRFCLRTKTYSVVFRTQYTLHPSRHIENHFLCSLKMVRYIFKISQIHKRKITFLQISLFYIQNIYF